MAAEAGNWQIVSRLLTVTVDLDARDSQKGNSALCFAASSNQTSVIDNLIGHGANIELTNKNGDTPLMLAIRANQHLAVSSLLRHGAKLPSANWLSQHSLSPETQEVISIYERDLAGLEPLVQAIKQGRDIGASQIEQYFLRYQDPVQFISNSH